MAKKAGYTNPHHYRDSHMPSPRQSAARRVELPFGITIVVEPSGSAFLTSALARELVDEDCPDADIAGQSATDAIESLLLALVAAHVDLDTPEAHEAIVTAVEQVANYL